MKTGHKTPDTKCGSLCASVKSDLPPAIASYFSY
jgi:hypothetical protein